MPAANDTFPWTSHYGHFKFFEARMNEHSRVFAIAKIGDGIYEIVRDNGSSLRVFVCECYSYGMAEYIETVSEIGAVDAVVINGNWCSYTLDLKRHCYDERVGIFSITGFMAALNLQLFWKYLDDDEKEYFRAQGWI